MLDLTQLGELRIKLDQMAERIISRVKDRSRFPQNPAVYEKDAVEVKGRKGVSFLEFALEGLENYHASLGRFDYPDQTPLVIRKFSSKAGREVPEAGLGIAKVGISVKEDIFSFYLRFIKKLCPSGEDKTTFGETAYCDADLLELLNERINLGRFVAESKLKSDRSIASAAAGGDRGALVAKLRNAAREEEVVAKAKEAAARYGLDGELVGELFKWIVEETIKVEAEYLQKKLTCEEKPAGA
jgi:chorismate mutase